MSFFESGPPVEFCEDADDVIDVHSFRAQERLKVHEARTDADMWSRVERHATAVPCLTRRVTRTARKVA